MPLVGCGWMSYKPTKPDWFFNVFFCVIVSIGVLVHVCTYSVLICVTMLSGWLGITSRKLIILT